MAKDILLQQFSTCYDENGWFVAVRNALEGLTAEQASWKPEGADNSIWETLAHLTYYNHAYLERFKGVAYQYDKDDNDATFEQEENASDEAWRNEVAKFDAVMNEWRGLLAAADESKFGEPVPTKPERKWAELLGDINAHNAYHGGQILLLRKLQGSWDPDKGVS